MFNLVQPWVRDIVCTDLIGRQKGQITLGPRLDRGPGLSGPALGWLGVSGAGCGAQGGCCSVLRCFWELGITRADFHTDSDHLPWKLLEVLEAPSWVVTARCHLHGQGEKPAKQQG